MLPDWRTIKIKSSKTSDKSDKSPLLDAQNQDLDTFCHFCHQNSEIEKSNSADPVLIPAQPESFTPGPEDTSPPPVEPAATGPEDTQTAPVESTEGATDTQQAPDLDAWRRRIIEKEQSGWTPERRQAQENEIRRVEVYRQQRGPAPSGPSPAGSIPRAEIFAAIGAVMKRLSKIWPSGLDTDPAWQDAVNEAAASGDRKTFLDAIQRWEQAESARVESYMSGIRREVSSWPDPYRRRFSLTVKFFMDGNRGYGLTVPALNPNQAQEKTYRDLLPHVQKAERNNSLGE